MFQAILKQKEVIIMELIGFSSIVHINVLADYDIYK